MGSLSETICKPQVKRKDRDGGKLTRSRKKEKKGEKNTEGNHINQHTKEKAMTRQLKWHVSPTATFLEQACPETQKRKDKVRVTYGAQDHAE